MLDLMFETRSLENPSVPLSSEEAVDWLTSGGATVSTESALTLSAVYSCINILSSSLAQLPLYVLRRTTNADGREVIEKAEDHAAWDLINFAPNGWETSSDWREMKMFDACGYGNGLTMIRRSRSGELQELVTAKANMTSLVSTGGRHYYSVQDQEGASFNVYPEDMIHLKAIGMRTDWGKWGKSPITQQREAIGLGLESQNYGKKFFTSGGKPTGVTSVKGGIGDKEWQTLKAAWKSIMNKLRDGTESRNILLPADLQYHPITVAPEDAQFLETQKFTRSQIAGIFNVPPHMIGDLEKATFSNISEQAVSFVRHTMMPWVVKLEQELTRKLFSSAERKAGYYAKFDLTGLLRGTPKDRAEFYNRGINDGWMNRNEARVFENMNPVEGLDEFLVAVNQAQPIGDADNENEPVEGGGDEE